MARYFFDIDDGEAVTMDEQGLDLDTLQQVRSEAIRVLPDVARDVLPDGDQRQIIVHVRDDGGRRIFTASLALRAEWLD